MAKVPRDNIVSILAVAERIRTPMMLGGLVILVLYLVFRQILALDVFSRVNQGDTFKLLHLVISGLLVLAIVAIVLGILAYLLALRLKQSIPAETRSQMNLAGLTFGQAADTIASTHDFGIIFEGVPQKVLETPMKPQQFQFINAVQGLRDLRAVTTRAIPAYNVVVEDSVITLSIKGKK